MLASGEDIVLVADAANGREAIEQFCTHRPDVTLLDVQIREEFPDARYL